LYKELYENTKNSSYIKQRANSYGGLSWNLLFDEKFVEANEAAQMGLKLDSTAKWINTNLAHSLLFQGRYEDAKSIYETWKNKEGQRGKKYKDLYLEDFDELEKAGITCKDIEKIRQLLK